jgi:hypothetical protein
MKPVPVRDPESLKYPDREFMHGQWRTPEQAERKREADRERQKMPHNRLRILLRDMTSTRINLLTPAPERTT